jgi:hypothetical protein
MTETIAVRMKNGYAFELTGDKSWRRASDDDWDTVVYNSDGRELPQGARFIDSSLCVVFLCSDGHLRAQLTHYVAR